MKVWPLVITYYLTVWLICHMLLWSVPGKNGFNFENFGLWGSQTIFSALIWGWGESLILQPAYFQQLYRYDSTWLNFLQNWRAKIQHYYIFLLKKVQPLTIINTITLMLTIKTTTLKMRVYSSFLDYLFRWWLLIIVC